MSYGAKLPLDKNHWISWVINIAKITESQVSARIDHAIELLGESNCILVGGSLSFIYPTVYSAIIVSSFSSFREQNTKHFYSPISNDDIDTFFFP